MDLKMEFSGFIQKVFEKIDKLDKEKIKEIIRELSAEKELYRIVFDSMIEGVIVTNWEKKVILINRAMEDFISVPKQKVLNRELCECKFDPEIEEVIEEGIADEKKIIDTKKNLIFCSLRKALRSNNIIPIDANTDATYCCSRSKPPIGGLDMINRVYIKIHIALSLLQKTDKNRPFMITNTSIIEASKKA